MRQIGWLEYWRNNPQEENLGVIFLKVIDYPDKVDLSLSL